MPKFKVCVQRYVEETALVEIEADTAADAARIGDQKLADGDIDNWLAGDDILTSGDYAGTYAVLDERGDDVEWER